MDDDTEHDDDHDLSDTIVGIAIAGCIVLCVIVTIYNLLAERG